MSKIFCALSREGKADLLRSGPIRFPGPFPKNHDNRSFQKSWFERFDWLEYNSETDGAQCFYCKYLATPANKNDEFRSGLVKNWRKFIEIGEKHEKKSDVHKHCVSIARDLIEADDRQKETLQEKLIKASEADKERNRKGIAIMFSVARWLATQNLAFRGHEDSNGNFQSFMFTFRQFMPDLDNFLSACPKNATYMSWKMQNNFIQIIDELTVNEILKHAILQNRKPFSVIMDETTDTSTKNASSHKHPIHERGNRNTRGASGCHGRSRLFNWRCSVDEAA